MSHWILEWPPVSLCYTRKQTAPSCSSPVKDDKNNLTKVIKTRTTRGSDNRTKVFESFQSSPFLRRILKESRSWKLLFVPSGSELQSGSWSPATMGCEHTGLREIVQMLHRAPIDANTGKRKYTNFVTRIQEREMLHLTPHVVFHSLCRPIVIW